MLRNMLRNNFHHVVQWVKYFLLNLSFSYIQYSIICPNNKHLLIFLFQKFWLLQNYLELHNQLPNTSNHSTSEFIRYLKLYKNMLTSSSVSKRHGIFGKPKLFIFSREKSLCIILMRQRSFRDFPARYFSFARFVLLTYCGCFIKWVESICQFSFWKVERNIRALLSFYFFGVFNVLKNYQWL